MAPAELKMRTTNQKPKLRTWVIVVLIAIALVALLFGAYLAFGQRPTISNNESFVYESIPAFSGNTSYEVNGGVPFFTESEITDDAYELYSSLDSLGRCGSAIACLSKELMPTEERGSIGMIKPTGWHTVRYDDLIKDKYLYNRCHLIAYMLSGENANEKNLITGTRHMNVAGMLPYEIEVGDYLESTNNHVMYRVTPIFVDSELLARGVLMEAYSVEDSGRGVSFNVFIYNVQPGIEIDYSTGESWIT